MKGFEELYIKVISKRDGVRKEYYWIIYFICLVTGQSKRCQRQFYLDNLIFFSQQIKYDLLNLIYV